MCVCLCIYEVRVTVREYYVTTLQRCDRIRAVQALLIVSPVSYFWPIFAKNKIFSAFRDPKPNSSLDLRVQFPEPPKIKTLLIIIC